MKTRTQIRTRLVSVALLILWRFRGGLARTRARHTLFHTHPRELSAGCAVSPAIKDAGFQLAELSLRQHTAIQEALQLFELCTTLLRNALQQKAC